LTVLCLSNPLGDIGTGLRDRGAVSVDNFRALRKADQLLDRLIGVIGVAHVLSERYKFLSLFGNRKPIAVYVQHSERFFHRLERK